MKVIEQSHEILSTAGFDQKIIELAGRTCYKSEKSITDKSANAFVRTITERGHHSVLEHANATVKFVTDRGVTHELVRHRLAAYSQESTRYVNYGKREIEFIRPVWASASVDEFNDSIGDIFRGASSLKPPEHLWLLSCMRTALDYEKLLELEWTPEKARSVLNNSLKTEIVMTANAREWLHIFSLRCSAKAHPQMRALMLWVLDAFYEMCPAIYESMWDKYLL